MALDTSLCTANRRQTSRPRPAVWRSPENPGQPGFARLVTMLKDGPPKGRGYFIHAEHDYLADPEMVRSLFVGAGKNVRVQIVPGRDHVMEESPTQQTYILNAARFVSTP